MDVRDEQDGEVYFYFSDDRVTRMVDWRDGVQDVYILGYNLGSGFTIRETDL